jgi:uncharacterized protein YdeI (BOF family)
MIKARNSMSELRKKSETRTPNVGIRSLFGIKVSAFFRPSLFGSRVCFAAALLSTLSLSQTDCHRAEGKVLGKPPEGRVSTILAVRAGDTPQVTISGVMFEKCPVAGCWFRVRDRTGEMKVDTKTAGFVVVNVPLEATITVTGKVIPDGNDFIIEATGMRY